MGTLEGGVPAKGKAPMWSSMPVGEPNAFNFVFKFCCIGEVRNNNIHPKVVVGREHKAAVDNNPGVGGGPEHAVHADLAKPPSGVMVRCPFMFTGRWYCGCGERPKILVFIAGPKVRIVAMHSTGVCATERSTVIV